MELRQLRYFIAVAEELHFRRAAERLHISQPPLSQQIRALEDELGFALLTRTRRRVELTPAGEAFLRDARAMLGELDGAVATARRIDAGQTGRLRVGFVGSALLSIVPGIVRAVPRLATRRRDRAARALDGRPAARGQRRRRRRRARAPADRATTASCARETVLRERTVAALPAGHPLARLGRVPLRAAGGRAAGAVPARSGARASTTC